VSGEGTLKLDLTTGLDRNTTGPANGASTATPLSITNSPSFLKRFQ